MGAFKQFRLPNRRYRFIRIIIKTKTIRITGLTTIERKANSNGRWIITKKPLVRKKIGILKQRKIVKNALSLS